MMKLTMERRQPYTEIPYRPAESGSRPYYGSTGSGQHGIPVSRSYPAVRPYQEEDDAAALAAHAESERIRALVEAERERTYAEAARRRALAEDQQDAELRAREQQADLIREEARVEAARQANFASEERLAAEADARHSTPERETAQSQIVAEPDTVWYKGATMTKRVIIAVITVFVFVLAYYWWKQHQAAADVANGEIYSNDLTPGSKTRSGDTTPVIAKPAPPVQTVTGTDGATTIMPATDSQSANAPNGMRFSGSGKFQVYRQGNLTWRVNTETGESCVLFATEEEWRKPIVFNHGCAAS